MVSASASLECRPSAEAAALSPVEFLDAAQAEDRKKWLDLWSSWPQREVMAHPEYVRLFARPGDRVIGAALRTASGGILYPVIVRPIASEPWAPSGARGCDLTTAYGYGGPFAWSVTPDDARGFWQRFDAWAATQGVATSFARLSLFSGQLLPFNGETASGGPNVVRRVETTDDALWNDYRCDARRNVDIARERGVTIEFDAAGRRLDEFLDIYTSTMDRRGATRGYYFPRSFFEAFIEKLSGHFTFVHAVLKDRVVSSEILLLAAEHAYSYLGGTRAEAFSVGPNYLIKHESFRWCRDQGKKAVVLGGGYQPNDGILKFKQRFGRASEVPFLLGRKTYDADEARRLVECRQSWERQQGRDWSPAPEFFPPYRS
ncbi:MAG TPA: GNAT family N-acetyltransferase [Planctomycetota bacterium]|jgi:hypothetical protein|nr:GNAT family N-acetyltransferase [Planctomycetota bacterium]